MRSLWLEANCGLKFGKVTKIILATNLGNYKIKYECVLL